MIFVMGKRVDGKRRNVNIEIKKNTYCYNIQNIIGIYKIRLVLPIHVYVIRPVRIILTV